MAQERTAWEQASDWFGRTIAIVMVMVAPGALGAWLDKQLKTEFLTGVGFLVGMALAITLLLVFVRIKTVDNGLPIARKTHGSTARGSIRDLGSTPPSEMKLPNLPSAEVREDPSRDD